MGLFKKTNVRKVLACNKKKRGRQIKEGQIKIKEEEKEIQMINSLILNNRVHVATSYNKNYNLPNVLKIPQKNL